MNFLHAILALLLVRTFRRVLLILLLLCAVILAAAGILTGMVFHRQAPLPEAASPDAAAWGDFGILTYRVFSKKNLRTQGFRSESVGFGSVRVISWMLGEYVHGCRESISAEIAPWECDGFRLEFNDGVFRGRLYLHCDKYSLLWGGATTLTVDFVPEIAGDGESVSLHVLSASAGDLPLPPRPVERILNRYAAAAAAELELRETIRSLHMTDKTMEVEYAPSRLIMLVGEVPLLSKLLSKWL